MKTVALVDPIPRRRGFVNKDASGGFGTVSDFGASFGARVLTWAKRRGIRYPVVSLGYVAAIFERAGWEVRYGQDAAVAKGADLVLIYTSLVAHRSELAAAREAKSLGGPRVGFIGPFASVAPEKFLDHADFVIRGEPERGVERLAGGEILDGVHDAKLVDDLDSLPFPAWRHFQPERFRYLPYFPGRHRFFPILGSRGCSMSCAYYCPYTAVTGRLWRKRSPGNIVAEIENLVSEFRATKVLFRDPLFTLDRGRTVEIARGIRNARLPVEWVCETHMDFLDEDLLDEMQVAGLRSIKVGIESPNPESLRLIKRRQPPSDKISRILAHCERRGIGVVAFYILGLPADTHESVQATIDYAIHLNTLGAQFTIATPYPGTGYFEEASRRGDLLTEDWERFDIYTPVIRHAHLAPDELQRLKAKAYQRYYVRASWVWQSLLRLANRSWPVVVPEA